MRRSCFPLLILSAVVLGCESEPLLTPDLQPEAQMAVFSGWEGSVPYIVAARADLPENLADLIGNHGGTLRSTIPQIGVAVAESNNPGFPEALSREAGIAFVIPDAMEELPSAPHATGDGVFGPAGFDGLLWGMDIINAPEAWAAGVTGAGVRVAILDSGIDAEHPDLAPNVNTTLSASFVPCQEGMWDGAPGPGEGNCVDGFEDWNILPGFYFNHGTHTAGIAAASGDRGVSGVAPEADLVAIKVCTEFADFCPNSSILAGIVHAAQIEADVANLSLGSFIVMRNDFVPWCRSLGYPAPFCGSLAGFNARAQAEYVANAITVFRRAFQYAFEQGTTVVVAAGNSGIDFDRSKDLRAGYADFPHTIGVSALAPRGWCLDPLNTDVDEPTRYTNFGRSIIDVAAPGGDFGPPGFRLPGVCALPWLDWWVAPTWAFDGVWSTISEGWGWTYGTSMAAPHVTGVAALIIGENGGDMSPQAVLRELKKRAVDLGPRGRDKLYGAGRIHTGY